MVALNPDRLAVFSYAHVPKLKRQQRSFEKYLPSEEEKLQLFVDATDKLVGAGYDHIGMDHFAKPGDPLVIARNNGRPTRLWFALGLVFGVWAVATLLVSPKRA